MKPTTKDTSLKFMDYIKNADRILRLLGRIFLVLLVFWILWAFRKAIKDESYVFDTFSVPPALIEKGSPNDGNSWDTYAEVMALKGDGTRFFAYLEKPSKIAIRPKVLQPSCTHRTIGGKGSDNRKSFRIY